jgi:hypothetical protein
MVENIIEGLKSYDKANSTNDLIMCADKLADILEQTLLKIAKEDSCHRKMIEEYLNTRNK